MKIKMRTMAAGPDGTHLPGQTYEVDEQTALAYVGGGYADPVDFEKPVKTTQSAENTGTEPAELKHLGFGKYQLPNGEVVQGKKNAEKALEDLKAGEQDGTQADNFTNSGAGNAD